MTPSLPRSPQIGSPQAVAVPDGWRLVPVKPTHAMQMAGWEAAPIHPTFRSVEQVAGPIWKAMLAAAPEGARP